MIIRALAALFLILHSAQLRAESLYVFFPTTARAKVVQSYIDKVCTNLDVTVFGRQRDFNNQIVENPPNAILAAPIVIQSMPNFDPVLVARRKGSVFEDYFLVSVKDTISLKALEGLKVGAVDLLGAKSMQAHMNKLLMTEVKVKRVTKLEDLLPLISFAAVDTLFISRRTLEFIQSKTAIDLKVTPSDIALGIASVAIATNSKSDNEAIIRECIGLFGNQINDVFGVDEWK